MDVIEGFTVQKVTSREGIFKTVLLIRERKAGEQGVPILSANEIIEIMLNLSADNPRFTEGNIRQKVLTQIEYA